MRLKVRSRDVELSEDLRGRVEAAVLAALERFGRRIGLVKVRLAAPASAAGARCRLTVRLEPVGGIAVEERGPSATACLARALERVAAVIPRELLRRRSLRTSRQLQPALVTLK